MTLRESLAERFRYEGRIGRFDQFAVFAAYVDESGNHRNPPDRIVVAAAMASAQNWLDFEAQWRPVIEAAKAQRGLKDFHAKDGSEVQELLNRILAYLMRLGNIQSYVITMCGDDYMAETTRAERSQLGNAFGFASFGCVTIAADIFRRASSGAMSAFYIERGGPGFAKTMQFLAESYRDEAFRIKMGLGSYGPANRAEHLPVHTADMLAHEVFSRRDESIPLTILGDTVTIQSMPRSKIREILDEYAVILRHVKREQSRQKLARKHLKRRLL